MDSHQLTEIVKKILVELGEGQSSPPVTLPKTSYPVLVTTDKRGVFFGYTENKDARPITLTKIRMCLYWASGGVLGLTDKGPLSGFKISAPAPSGVLEGVTAVFDVSQEAEKAWVNFPTQGR